MVPSLTIRQLKSRIEIIFPQTKIADVVCLFGLLVSFDGLELNLLY